MWRINEYEKVFAVVLLLVVALERVESWKDGKLVVSAA